MESLADQEISEANFQMSLYFDTASKASLFLGMSAVFVVAVPALVIVLRFIGSQAAYEIATTGGLLAIAWFAYGAWLHIRAKSAFAQLRASCLKLQRAGFSIYMKYESLHHILAAKPSAQSAGVKTLDFENITPRQLRATKE